MAITYIRFYSLAKFKTIHQRHNDITHHQIYEITIQSFQSLFTIGSGDYSILRR